MTERIEAPPQRRPLLAALLVAALGIGVWGRVVWPARHAASPADVSEAAEYAERGEALLHRYNPFSYGLSQNLPSASLLAARLFAHHSDPAAWASWIVLFQAGAILGVLALGRILASWGCALLAGALLVLVPGALPGAIGYPQNVYSLLLLLVAGLLVWRAQAPSPRRSLVLALAIGASLLFRSPLAFLPPLLAGYDWLAGRRSWVLLFVPYAFLIPWVWMNWAVHGRFIPLEYQRADHEIITAAVGVSRSGAGNAELLLDRPVDTLRTGAVLRWAAGRVLRHPGEYLGGYLRRLRYFFLLHPLLWALAAAAVWRFRGRDDVRQLALLACCFAAAHLFLAATMRYFEPLWPLLVALTALALARPFGLGAERREGPGLRLAHGVLFGGLAACLLLSASTVSALAAFASAARGGSLDSPAALERALAEDPADSWLLAQRGERRLLAGDLPGAAADLERSLAQPPYRPDLELELAWTRSALGDPGALLSWQLKPEPADPVPQALQAIDARWRRAFALGPSDHPVLYRHQSLFNACLLKAAACLRDGRREEARAQVRSAAELCAGYEPMEVVASEPERRARERLRSACASLYPVKALLEARPPAERLFLLEALTESAPDQTEFWIERAELETAAGRRASARASLQRAERLRPSFRQSERIAALFGATGTAPTQEGAR